MDCYVKINRRPFMFIKTGCSSIQRGKKWVENGWRIEEGFSESENGKRGSYFLPKTNFSSGYKKGYSPIISLDMHGSNGYPLVSQGS